MNTIYLDGIVGKQITLKSVLIALEKNPDATTILINSYGGSLSEGLAIHDYLKSNKQIIDCGATGMCASAATPILLSKYPNCWGTPNSRFLIHNPSQQVEGDAAYLSKVAGELQREQDNMVIMYAGVFGKTGEEVTALMAENKELMPQEAMDLKLITNIKGDNMDNKEVLNELSGLKTMLVSIGKLFKGKVSNLVVIEVNGKELDFGPEVTEPAQIVVGAKCTIDGKPAEGEYTMADGSMIKFVAGAVTEIVPKAEESELDMLKKENEALKKQVEDSAAKTTQIENDFSAYKIKADAEFKEYYDKFEKFTKNFSSDVVLNLGKSEKKEDVPTERFYKKSK